jgi:hypothetical protein
MSANTVYVPVIIYGREKYEYHADTLGVFRDEVSAFRALIKKLVEGEWLLHEFCFDSESTCKEEVTWNGKELIKGDTEHNIDILCKDVKTIEDVKAICNEFNDSYYDDGWKFEVNKFEIQ